MIFRKGLSGFSPIESDIFGFENLLFLVSTHLFQRGLRTTTRAHQGILCFL